MMDSKVVEGPEHKYTWKHNLEGEYHGMPNYDILKNYTCLPLNNWR